MEHQPELMLRTIATAISAGIILLIFARRFNIPAIVLLLFGGIVLGPEGLGIVQPSTLGDGLSVIVSLAIGLILFEGGLTLNLEGYRLASGVIRRLLTVGVAITWLGTAAAATLILDIELPLALLASSMVIVTGPTVIGPLLKRIRIHPRLHHILHWESVLIDPIGVFIAILCFEWISGPGGGTALVNFGMRLLWGLAIGIVGGLATDQLIRRKSIPEDSINIYTLAAAVIIFEVAELVRSEAGLLSVAVGGFVLGLRNPVELKQIRKFKSEITDLLIGVLFILLAARLNIDQFIAFGQSGLLLVAVVMFLIRPLNIMASAVGTDVRWRERAFLSWLAPRGIVAASMASLFALRLEGAKTVSDPRLVETFTYSVIVATVVIQGFSAGPLARLLGLEAKPPTGWMIVGAHRLGRRVAKFISDSGKLAVVIVDTNARATGQARQEGLASLTADARDTTLQERQEMQGIGYLLALTDNDDLNILLCQRWAEVMGRDKVFRWSPANPTTQKESPGTPVWSRVPKPSLVSAEMERAEAAALEVKELKRKSSPFGTPILATTRNGIVLDPAGLDEAKAKEVSAVLYLRRDADYLMRSIRPELVVRLHATTCEQLFAELVDEVIKHDPGVPRDDTIKDLVERERAWPTTLGHGIAVPHAYSGSLVSRLCVVAQVPEGLEFKAPDGQKVQLVFLLLSPQGDPEGHLATMADIARLVSDTQVREKLINAHSPAELLGLIRQFTAL